MADEVLRREPASPTWSCRGEMASGEALLGAVEERTISRRRQPARVACRPSRGGAKRISMTALMPGPAGTAGGQGANPQARHFRHPMFATPCRCRGEVAAQERSKPPCCDVLGSRPGAGPGRGRDGPCACAPRPAVARPERRALEDARRLLSVVFLTGSDRPDPFLAAIVCTFVPVQVRFRQNARAADMCILRRYGGGVPGNR